MRSPVIRFLLFFGLLSASSFAHATTYYVAPSGSDSGACNSASAPCKTIGHAVSLATTGGDIVQVGAGTYAESVTLSHSGSSGAVITLRGQTGSGCPTTAVTDVNSPTGTHPVSQAIVSGTINVNANYLAIDCLHLKGNSGINVSTKVANSSITHNEIEGTGTTGGGISFAGIASVSSSQYAQNFTIAANYIHGVSTGIFLVCNSCTITDNEITALTGNEPGSDHDYIDAWGIGSTFRHNYMHGNTCNACQGYDCHMDCIQTWNTTGNGTEVSKNITFDRNICFNHHEGVIVQDNAGNGDVANWTVTNNVFSYGPYDDGSGHLCAAGPAHPWCWVFEDGNLGTSNNFSNNTCIDGAEGFRNNSGSALFKDNLYLSRGGQTSVYDTGGAKTSGSNNMYYATSGSFGGGDYPGDISDKDPKIVSQGSGGSSRCIGCNFNIQSTSAARDAGVSTGVGVDLLGTARPQGSAYDIGAYEFVSGTQAAAPGAPTNLTGVVH
jgi:hypothetical protein